MGVQDCYNKYLKTSAGVSLDGNTGNIAASFNTESYDVTFSYGFQVSLVYTGDAVGTVKLQASNPIVDPVTADWADIDGTEFALTTGSPIIWNVIDFNGRWWRLVYTRTSGDLVPKATVTAKG